MLRKLLQIDLALGDGREVKQVMEVRGHTEADLYQVPLARLVVVEVKQGPHMRNACPCGRWKELLLVVPHR